MPRTLRLYKEPVVIKDKITQGEEQTDVGYDDPVTYLAHIERGSQQIRNQRGEQDLASVKIDVAPAVLNSDGTVTFLDEVPLFSAEAHITLPDDDKPLIKEVRSALDQAGRRHVELYC